MEAAKVLKEAIGDLVVFDVGGATTDVHSVTEGSEEITRLLISPEPEAKRTVEGDLGVFVNMGHIVETMGREELLKEFPDLDELLAGAKPIPDTDRSKAFVERLTTEAMLTAMERHAGRLRQLYGATGKRTIAEGKDLTAVKYVVGTGGALTRLPHHREILAMAAGYGKGLELYPKREARVLVDNHYIMASLGVLSKRHPEDALKLMLSSLDWENSDRQEEKNEISGSDRGQKEACGKH